MFKAVEEYAEATAALVRLANTTDNPPFLTGAAEELADAEIMSMQLRIIYPEIDELISEIRARKLAALAARTGFPEAVAIQTANAEFIAHAPADIEYLLAEVERLTADLVNAQYDRCKLQERLIQETNINLALTPLESI